ncbi:MAG TPA: hypothetical protein VIX15_11750, partial [Streptosporangiaceae bacterium]
MGEAVMRTGWRTWNAASAVPLAVALLASACSPPGAASPSDPGAIVAVGAENEYANVIAQVGGKYVQASASVAREVSAAQLVVQNGVGYDTFMNTIENA